MIWAGPSPTPWHAQTNPPAQTRGVAGCVNSLKRVNLFVSGEQTQLGRFIVDSPRTVMMHTGVAKRVAD